MKNWFRHSVLKFGVRACAALLESSLADYIDDEETHHPAHGEVVKFTRDLIARCHHLIGVEGISDVQFAREHLDKQFEMIVVELDDGRVNRILTNQHTHILITENPEDADDLSRIQREPINGEKRYFYSDLREIMIDKHSRAYRNIFYRMIKRTITS